MASKATSGTGAAVPEGLAENSEVDEPEVATDYAQAATDQIMARIQEDFAGHDLANLVAAVLEVDGFECLVSPPGPDGGIDISAGRGHSAWTRRASSSRSRAAARSARPSWRSFKA
ncbi:MAG: hypothetical protein GEU83_17115 [Pseudonocardiaceae bacterium]|nr:hypothetical protein [Pseudonocardiaceae bacterium]